MKTNKLFIALLATSLLTGCNTNGVKSPKFASFKNEVERDDFYAKLQEAYKTHEAFNDESKISSYEFDINTVNKETGNVKYASKAKTYKSETLTETDFAVAYDNQNNTVKQKGTEKTTITTNGAVDGVLDDVTQTQESTADVIMQIGTVNEQKHLISIDKITGLYFSNIKLDDTVDNAAFMEKNATETILFYTFNKFINTIASYYDEEEKNCCRWYVDEDVFTFTYSKLIDDYIDLEVNRATEDDFKLQLKLGKKEISYKCMMISTESKEYFVNSQSENYLKGDKLFDKKEIIINNIVKFKDVKIEPLDLTKYKQKPGSF